MCLFQNNPPDLTQCVFVIEQALSVRALQELVTAAASESVKRIFMSLFLAQKLLLSILAFKGYKPKLEDIKISEIKKKILGMSVSTGNAFT